MMKVPPSVIITEQRKEIKALKKKNHDIVSKAKEREQQWKEYSDGLLDTIEQLKAELKESDDKAVRRFCKAQKKVNEDYQQLLDENRKLKAKVESYKREIATLTADLEGRPIEKDGPSRIQVRKAFNKLTNRRAIMDAMGYPYNESIAVAYNVVLFLEWVRNNAKWHELYIHMEQSKKKQS